VLLWFGLGLDFDLVASPVISSLIMGNNLISFDSIHPFLYYGTLVLFFNVASVLGWGSRLVLRQFFSISTDISWPLKDRLAKINNKPKLKSRYNSLFEALFFLANLFFPAVAGRRS